MDKKPIESLFNEKICQPREFFWMSFTRICEKEEKKGLSTVDLFKMIG